MRLCSSRFALDILKGLLELTKNIKIVKFEGVWINSQSKHLFLQTVKNKIFGKK